MPQYLLISGSPRKGNTDFVLSKIADSIKEDSETIILRQKKIKHCIGCLMCHNKPECVIQDDMKEILDKMIDSKVIIIGTPNYFGNISGLLKDFIDRTHPVYTTSLLKGKKIILIMTGGSDVDKSAKYLAESTAGFIKYQKLDLIGSYCFQALNSGELSKDEKREDQIRPIIQQIKNI